MQSFGSFYFFLLVLLLQACTNTKPAGSFDSARTPMAPDYANPANWAALPDRFDAADLTPPSLEDQQDDAVVDVFFLHPTIYIGRKGEDHWNGPVDDPELNSRTDSSTIKFQASVFNGVGRVFAPRYRQAHYNSYFNEDTASAQQAFEVAYQDVARAFQYYLDHYNEGRPVILASHSQGTTHAKKLLKEFFDGKTLQNRLVVAYLVGIPVGKNEFAHIPICKDSIMTGCYCTWRTFKSGKEPNAWKGPHIAVTNPISWTITDEAVPKAENKGAVLRKFEVQPGMGSARIADDLGLVWTEKPKVFGISLLNGNYHRIDYNLYYLDIRENARLRVRLFWKN